MSGGSLDDPLAGQSAPPWHVLEAGPAAVRLGSDLAAGLTVEEAARRLGVFGSNDLPEAGRRGLAAMIAAQFADVSILVLIAAALLSGIIGDIEDVLVIAAIILINGAIGLTQDYRAARALEAVRQLAPRKASVMRSGRRQVVAAADLVPGDIVLLEAGDSVPADLRLIGVPALKANESALTGESAPVDKQADALREAHLAVGDRTNMAFRGTQITYGRASGLVVATGKATEFGKIAGMLLTVTPPPTPLEKKLRSFGKRLALVILVLCLAIFLAGVERGEAVPLALLTALSVAVAAIPEALPAVVTVMLALGSRAMARRQALVKRLSAVEALGSVSVICADKTGTLTRNEMQASEILLEGRRRPAASLDGSTEPGRSFLEALALCNDAEEAPGGFALGDPTEIALLRLAAGAGFDQKSLESEMPRVRELPFESGRKRMTTFHRREAGFIAYTKGAPEAVLPQCKPSAEGADPIAIAEAMAGDGLRVIAVASRFWDALPASDQIGCAEQDLTFLGLAGLWDPPRPKVKSSVALCRSAGILPIMITGDHPETAAAIARGLGILDSEGKIITGSELERMAEDELSGEADRIRVYARCDPAQKIRIVTALQRRGHRVAMTGDGVNDAPALAAADVGVAMGRGGTDVAREAASLVLLDDDFATIVSAVSEGRKIFGNIRKFISYVLACNLAEILIVFLAPPLGLPAPLLPIHILWINLVTDGLPGLAFAAEPAEESVMRQAPLRAGQDLFTGGMWQHVLAIGLVLTVLALSVEAWAVQQSPLHRQTMVFTLLTLAQMANALATRSERASLFEQGLLSNRPLFGAVLLTISLQLALIYVPVFNSILDTAPLTATELAICVSAAALILLASEIEKWLARRNLIYKRAGHK